MSSSRDESQFENLAEVPQVADYLLNSSRLDERKNLTSAIRIEGAQFFSANTRGDAKGENTADRCSGDESNIAPQILRSSSDVCPRHASATASSGIWMR